MSIQLLQNDRAKYAKQLILDYNKTEKELDEYIDILQKWAETQPHFPEKPGYNILRYMILLNKFSIEETKKKVDMYYTIRNLMPEYFNNNPFTADRIFQNKVCYLVPLPKTVDNYARIVYNKMNPEYIDPKYFIHDKLIPQFIHLSEYLIHEDLSYRYHYISDCAGLKIGHGANLNAMAFKKTSIILELVFSNRVASFLMVNVPPVLESVINNLMKPLLNPKLRERVKVSKNTDILFEMFNKEVLPKDVGGEEKSAEELNELLMKEFERLQHRYLKVETFKVDESLRPSKLENDDVLGYYGSFRTINVD